MVKPGRFATGSPRAPGLHHQESTTPRMTGNPQLDGLVPCSKRQLEKSACKLCRAQKTQLAALLW